MRLTRLSPGIPLNVTFGFSGGETVYTVEKILDHRTGKRKNLKEFLVRWDGYDPANDLWEPEANIHDPTLVQDYWDYVASREQHTAQQANTMRTETF